MVITGHMNQLRRTSDNYEPQHMIYNKPQQHTVHRIHKVNLNKNLEHIELSNDARKPRALYTPACKDFGQNEQKVNIQIQDIHEYQGMLNLKILMNL